MGRGYADYDDPAHRHCGSAVFSNSTNPTFREAARFAGSLSVTVWARYVPAVAMGGTFVLRWSTDTSQLVVAPVCVVITTIVLGLLLWAVIVAFSSRVIVVRQPAPSTGTVKAVLRSRGANSETFLMLIKPVEQHAKDPSLLRHRLYFLEDLRSGILVGTVAGWRPASGSCTPVAAAMFVVMLCHFVYICAVQPLSTRMAMCFAVMFAAIQVAQAATAISLTTQVTSFRTALLAYLILVQNVSLVALAVAKILLMARLWIKHRSAKTAKETRQSAVPLLVASPTEVVVEMDEVDTVSKDCRVALDLTGSDKTVPIIEEVNPLLVVHPLDLGGFKK